MQRTRALSRWWAGKGRMTEVICTNYNKESRVSHICMGHHYRGSYSRLRTCEATKQVGIRKYWSEVIIRKQPEEKSKHTAYTCVWPRLHHWCARAEQSRRRERERERCVRALGEQDLALARQYRWFSETRFGRFFEGKKVAKVVCNVPKLATLCISISPTRGWTTGQTENTRCVNRALKKLVPLKWVCVNALLTH